MYVSNNKDIYNLVKITIDNDIMLIDLNTCSAVQVLPMPSYKCVHRAVKLAEMRSKCCKHVFYVTILIMCNMHAQCSRLQKWCLHQESCNTILKKKTLLER